jgi:hypothetical protein
MIKMAIDGGYIVPTVSTADNGTPNSDEPINYYPSNNPANAGFDPSILLSSILLLVAITISFFVFAKKKIHLNR